MRSFQFSALVSSSHSHGSRYELIEEETCLMMTWTHSPLKHDGTKQGILYRTSSLYVRERQI